MLVLKYLFYNELGHNSVNDYIKELTLKNINKIFHKIQYIKNYI